MIKIWFIVISLAILFTSSVGRSQETERFQPAVDFDPALEADLVPAQRLVDLATAIFDNSFVANMVDTEPHVFITRSDSSFAKVRLGSSISEKQMGVSIEDEERRKPYLAIFWDRLPANRPTLIHLMTQMLIRLYSKPWSEEQTKAVIDVSPHYKRALMERDIIHFYRELPNQPLYARLTPAEKAEAHAVLMRSLEDYREAAEKARHQMDGCEYYLGQLSN